MNADHVYEENLHAGMETDLLHENVQVGIIQIIANGSMIMCL